MLTEPKPSPKEETHKPNGRRLIKVDFSQFEDDEDDESFDSPESSEPGLWSTEYQQISDGTLEAYDLATRDLDTRSNLRRNTLEVCDPHLGYLEVSFVNSTVSSAIVN